MGLLKIGVYGFQQNDPNPLSSWPFSTKGYIFMITMYTPHFVSQILIINYLYIYILSYQLDNTIIHMSNLFPNVHAIYTYTIERIVGINSIIIIYHCNLLLCMISLKFDQYLIIFCKYCCSALFIVAPPPSNAVFTFIRLI